MKVYSHGTFCTALRLQPPEAVTAMGGMAHAPALAT
jgi:hypothetical protein